jgi:glycosyltransferase involved in cell wall biosynthesis
MRIAHFLLGRCDPHSANGVYQTVFHLSRAQSALGHEVAVFSIASEPAFPIAGVEVRMYAPAVVCRLPVGARLQELLGHRSPLNLPRQLRRDLVQWRPDIVHLHVMHIPQNAVLARDLHAAGIPYCFTPHGCLTREALRRNLLIKRISGVLFERGFLARAALLHMVSERDCEGLALYGLTTPTVIAPNGIDPTSVPARCNRQRLQQRYPQTVSARVLLYLGRIDIRQKGLDLLVQAMSEISPSTDVVAALVGPDWRDNLRQLRQLIASRGLAERVILAGPAYGREKWDLLASADVFVQASRWEAGISFSALEALAAGKPMLLTRPADPSGLVAECGAGEVVEPEPQQLARAIERMTMLPAADLIRMGSNARQLAEREFGWKPIAQTIAGAYERACATARARAVRTAGASSLHHEKKGQASV